MKIWWAVLLVVACTKDKPQVKPEITAEPGSAHPDAMEPAVATQPPPAPALPGGGERAFVTNASGLVEISDAGASQVVAPGDVTWCNADARGKLVWFATKDGLHAFDLEDRRVRPIIKADLDELEIIIDWGAQQQLGGEDELDFDAGVVLNMSGTPKLAQKIGCDGDRAHECYEEDGTTPTQELAAKLKRVDSLQLADPTYVASLAKRGASGSLWTPPPAPPKRPKAPKVPRKACEEDPKDCGKLTAIPGSSLWLVTTANSRGDYYHETRELYDPATAEFVRFDGSQHARVKTPRGEGLDFAGLRIAPNGTLSHVGAVFTPTKIIYMPKIEESSRTCGWASGGWRMPGARG